MVYSQVMDISFFDKIIPHSSQVDCSVKQLRIWEIVIFFDCSFVMWMPVCFAFSRF